MSHKSSYRKQAELRERSQVTFLGITGVKVLLTRPV